MPYFNKGGGWSARFINKFRSMLGSPFKHTEEEHAAEHAAEEKKPGMDLKDRTPKSDIPPGGPSPYKPA